MRGKSGKYLFLVWGAILFAILAVFYLPKCKRPQTEEVALEISEWIQVLEDGEERAVYLPEKLNKGRLVYRRYPNCACVEVYEDCCRVINEDSTVIKIPNNNI